jgi:hypothetical protein
MLTSDAMMRQLQMFRLHSLHMINCNGEQPMASLLQFLSLLYAEKRIAPPRIVSMYKIQFERMSLHDWHNLLALICNGVQLLHEFRVCGGWIEQSVELAWQDDSFCRLATATLHPTNFNWPPLFAAVA